VRHVNTHEKPDIECDLCHRVFGRPDHLKRHIATKHSSLSLIEQMYLSENLAKKKQRQQPPQQQQEQQEQVQSSQQQQLQPSSLQQPGIVNHQQPTLSQVLNLPQKEEPLMDPPQRPESELSTVSGAEINSVVHHPAFSPATLQPLMHPHHHPLIFQQQHQQQEQQHQHQQFRHHIDYSQMFPLAMPPTTSSPHPNNL
jgi:hypothetical protein